MDQTLADTLPGTEEDPKEKKPVPYSKDENEFRNYLTVLLSRMQQDRDQAHPELDGMTYLQYYESNRKKDLSYIPPKKNKQDTRIVTGTTREKDTTLVSTMLNLNFQPTIRAFIDDNIVEAELGDAMADMVKKSREIEEWERLRPIVYRELISQGDVYVEDTWIENFRPVPLEKLDWDPTKDGVSQFSITTRLKNVFSFAKSRQLNGKKVYVGNIRIPYLQDQRECVAVLNIYTRAEAKQIYGAWERWKYVPWSVDTGPLRDAGGGATYRDWNMLAVSEGQVAELKVFLPGVNRFAIILNGVLMLPINYPLTAISPSGEVPIAHGKLEPISDFFCGKSQPSKTKVDQDVLDEMTMLMIEGFRQMRKPPTGTAGKKVYSQDVFRAGHIQYGMKPGELFPIMPPQSGQISPAEFSVYELIKTGIDQKTVNPDFSGETVDKNQTAFEADQQKQQQILKLGLSLDGVVHLERSMTWNRIHTILTHWTQPIDSQVDDVSGAITKKYRDTSVETSLENGEKGLKMFRFTTGGFPDVHEQYNEEEKLAKQQGVPVRITYLNPEEISAMRYRWFVVIVPTPKSDDKLSQIMFMQNISQAIQLFGPDSLNLDYVKQRWAINSHEDYNKMFKKMDIMQMLQMGQGNPAVANALGQGAPAAKVGVGGSPGPTPRLAPMVQGA